MADTFFLRCMGVPELRGPDGRPVRIRVRKHLALLIYLAVEGRSRSSRDALVELLWSGAPDPDARHSLSTALSVLRGLLGREAIEGTGTSIRFHRQVLTLDLDALLKGGGSDGLAAEDSFLEDFAIPDAPAFMHWRDSQQACLLPVIQSALLERIDGARRTNDVQGLKSYGDRLLRLEPLSEDGVRARIEALALSGDRVAALREFEVWRAELAAELGAKPSESLEGLAQRLRRYGMERRAAATAAIPRDDWASRPFIGRASEFRAVYEAWESTTQLFARHVVIEGDTGVGKSTLAQRFATAVALEGAVCARVQCFELEQRIPFGMIGALVGTLLDRPGAVATDPAALAEIGRLVGRVRERFPQLPPPRPVEGEAARIHFAEGVLALLKTLAEEHPVVLVVDDYPRSDEASLSVLHLLLRRTGLDRVMIVLTARPAEPGEPPQAARIRKGVAALPLQRVPLGPLTEEESEALLSELVSSSGRRPKPPDRRAILRAAAGNPMAIELLAQDWLAHGDAAVVLSLPAMEADVTATAFDVTAYDSAVDRLMPRLSPRARAALWLATILGPRLNDLGMFELVGLEERRLVPALGELVHLRILRDSGGRLEFTNELMRARLYLQVPSGVRTKLHRAVARALVEVHEAGRDISGLEIAWHSMRAREPEAATPYLMSGARKAIAAGAPDEAARALSTALKHLKGRDRDEGTILLAETLQEMADWKGSLEVLAEIERKRSIDPTLGTIRDLFGTEARLRLGVYSLAESERIALQILESLPGLGSPETVARSLLFVARVGSELRHYSIWSGILSASATCNISSQDLRLRAMAILACAMSLHYMGRHQEALQALRREIALLDSSRFADSTVAGLHIGVGSICCALGLYEDGLGDTERALSIAKRLDNEELISTAAGNLALCHFRLGHYTEAKDLSTLAYTRALNKAETADFDLLRSIVQNGISAVFADLVAEVERATEVATSILRKVQVPWIRQFGSFLLADLLWIQGRKKDALKEAQNGLEGGFPACARQAIGRFARWAAIVGAQSGRPEEPLKLLLEIETRADELDEIDRIEVMCAIVCLELRLGIEDEARIQNVRGSLAKLPIPVSHQLQRLGILDFGSSQTLPEATLGTKDRSRLRARKITNRRSRLLSKELTVRE